MNKTSDPIEMVYFNGTQTELTSPFLTVPALYIISRLVESNAALPRSTPEISVPVRQHFYPQPGLTLLPLTPRPLWIRRLN